MTRAPADTENQLLRLEEMKRHRVAKNESDIRGWEVVTSDHRKVGRVHDLVVDVASMTVRYLDVEVEAKILGTKTPSHVLLPISGATLDDDDARVYLDEVSLSRLTALPPFDHRPITAAFEATVAGVFSKAPVASAPKPVDRVIEPADRLSEQPSDPSAMTAQERFWGERRRGRATTPYLAPVEDGEEPPRE